MKIDNATPRPWKIEDTHLQHDNLGLYDGGYEICTEGTYVASLTPGIDPVEAKANAELIVKAVNNHGKLIEALADLLVAFQAEADNSSNLEIRNRRRLLVAEQALANVQGD